MSKLIHFDEVRNNNLKSTILILFFFLLVGAIGYIVGLLWNNIALGVILTLIFGLIYTLIVWFAGKNMLMALAGAKEVTKKEYPFLYHTVEGLSISAGIPTPKCYVIDSPALNAFATGRNPKEGAVAVTTGLMDKLNREELEGVLAHEIAHIKNYDIRTMMLAAILVGVVVLLSDFFLRSMIWGGGSRNRDGKAQLIMIIAGIVLAILAPIIANMIKLAISRKNEYAADARAAVITRNPKALASALRKITKDPNELQVSNATAHMYIGNPNKKKTSWFRNLFSTHPPSGERIRRLESM